ADRAGSRAQRLAPLRRYEAAEKEREEKRDGGRERSAVSSDEAGAEEDRARNTQEDHRRHRQRLGQCPPERESDRARSDRREHARPAHGLAVTARARAAPTSHAAKAPGRMN